MAIQVEIANSAAIAKPVCQPSWWDLETTGQKKVQVDERRFGRLGLSDICEDNACAPSLKFVRQYLQLIEYNLSNSNDHNRLIGGCGDKNR